jgi:hypothetical protein
MYRLLIWAILIASLAQFKMSLFDLKNCRSLGCLRQLEKNARDITKINWRPIVIFPEEAKKLR